MEQGNFRPSSRGLEAREYFAEYSAWRANTLGDVAVETEAEDDEEVDEGPIEVLETGSVEPAVVTAASPKKYITLALDAGLTVKCWESKTLRRGTVFQSGPRTGEMRPDKITVNLWTTAFIPKGMAFQMRHIDNRFKNALTWDAAGWPTILQADYSYNKKERKSFNLTEQRAAEIELRMVNEYNDGEQWVNKTPRVVTSVTAFEEWLADLFPAFQAKAPAIKKTKEDVLMAPMMNGEWNG